MNSSESSHHPYSWVMTLVTLSFGLAGAVAGIVLAAANAREMIEANGFLGLLMAPIVFGIPAYLVGIACSFLFAPTRYLESEAGQKWLKLVGTKTVLSARIVCAILAAGALTGLVAIAVAFMNEQ